MPHSFPLQEPARGPGLPVPKGYNGRQAGGRGGGTPVLHNDLVQRAVRPVVLGVVLGRNAGGPLERGRPTGLDDLHRGEGGADPNNTAFAQAEGLGLGQWVGVGVGLG